MNGKQRSGSEKSPPSSSEDGPGLTKRKNFPAKVRREIIERSGGICECGCGEPFTEKDPVQVDHTIEAVLLDRDHKLTAKDGKALRKSCHLVKTKKRAPVLAKIVRLAKKRKGEITRRKAVIPGSKGSGYKKKLNGKVERRTK